jgi:hypothetical protein
MIASHAAINASCRQMNLEKNSKKIKKQRKSEVISDQNSDNEINVKSDSASNQDSDESCDEYDYDSDDSFKLAKEKVSKHKSKQDKKSWIHQRVKNTYNEAYFKSFYSDRHRRQSFDFAVVDAVAYGQMKINAYAKLRERLEEKIFIKQKKQIFQNCVINYGNAQVGNISVNVFHVPQLNMQLVSPATQSISLHKFVFAPGFGLYCSSCGSTRDEIRGRNNMEDRNNCVVFAQYQMS